MTEEKKIFFKKEFSPREGDVYATCSLPTNNGAFLTSPASTRTTDGIKGLRMMGEEERF
jgi:hypothetical protein